MYLHKTSIGESLGTGPGSLGMGLEPGSSPHDSDGTNLHLVSRQILRSGQALYY